MAHCSAPWGEGTLGAVAKQPGPGQVGWEASSRLCPGNGPLALLVMKGIILQHRQVWGTGTLTHR